MATTLQKRNQNVLGEAERRQLAECETAIQTAQSHKLAEAQALKTIRENRLYRATYKTFEIYCQTRWGYSRQHAQQLIDWAVVNDDLSTVVCTPDLRASALLA
ncbi:MAG TPA: hypothetical protein VG326_16010 [Tepidisphaeraceae bacterium]|jgi:hypothetical protein|nr:hypothetical protein [Tepidisphaeraceae bacterium]